MMMSTKKEFMLVALCVVLVANLIAANPVDWTPRQEQSGASPQQTQQQQSTATASSDEERITLDTFPDTFLVGQNCSTNERPAPGMMAICEPTCDNPNPICPKKYEVYDHMMCFCAEPLVRDTSSKECIPLGQCPKQSVDNIRGQEIVRSAS